MLNVNYIRHVDPNLKTLKRQQTHLQYFLILSYHLINHFKHDQLRDRTIAKACNACMELIYLNLGDNFTGVAPCMYA